jgi:hypothetical protein
MHNRAKSERAIFTFALNGGMLTVGKRLLTRVPRRLLACTYLTT